MSKSPVYSSKLGIAPERRLHPRHRIHSLSYVDVGSDNGGIVVDLSEEGMSLQAVGPLTASIEVRLRIQAPKSHINIEISAKVVWLGESNRLAGMRFLNLSSEEQGRIQEWIQSETQPKADAEESLIPSTIGSGFGVQPSVSDPPKRVGSVTELKLPELHIPIPSNIESTEGLHYMPALQDLSARLRKIPIPPKAVEDSINSEEKFEVPGETRTRRVIDDAVPSPLKPNANDRQSTPLTTTMHNDRDATDGLHRFPQQNVPKFSPEATVPRIPAVPPPRETIDGPQTIGSTPEALSIVPALPVLPPAVEKSHEVIWAGIAGALALFSILSVIIWARIASPVQDTVKNNVVGTVEESTETIAPFVPELSPTRTRKNGATARDVARNDQKTAATLDSPPVQQTEAFAPTLPNPMTPTPRKAEETSSAPPPVIRDPASASQTVTKITTADVQASVPASPLVPDDAQLARIVAGHVLRPTDRFNPCHLTYRVEPIYPEEAKRQRIEGIVKIHQVIGPDGNVVSVKLLSSPPLLAAAALDAAQHWHYLPALLNGQPVETEQDVEIAFRLPE